MALLLFFCLACSRGKGGGEARGDAAVVAEGLDGMLEAIRAHEGVPALAAAAFEGGRMLAIGAVGVRKVGDPATVTREDAWHLGSDTKAMTATLVALFVDEGKLAWSTTLAEAFPEWAGSMNAEYRDVTLQMLLSHRAGVVDPPDLGMLAFAKGSAMDVRRSAVESALGRAPGKPPGKQFLYSNMGYMIAGAVVERSSGVAWESLMRARIFEPLSMASCGFGAPGERTDQPWGHGEAGYAMPFADNPAAVGPAGTVHCSLGDWGKFLAMHLAGARGESAFVSKESFAKLQTAWPGGDYAMGWGIRTYPWSDKPILAHAGSNSFFMAVVWLSPSMNRVFVAATNIAGKPGEGATRAALDALVQRYARR